MADQYSLPNAPQEEPSKRKEIEHAIESIASAIKYALRPLPTQTGDGSYIVPPTRTGVFHDILETRPEDVKTLVETKLAEMTGDPVDDKTYLMERLIQVDGNIIPRVISPANSLSVVHQQAPIDLEEPD